MSDGPNIIEYASPRIAARVTIERSDRLISFTMPPGLVWLAIWGPVLSISFLLWLLMDFAGVAYAELTRGTAAGALGPLLGAAAILGGIVWQIDVLRRSILNRRTPRGILIEDGSIVTLFTPTSRRAPRPFPLAQIRSIAVHPDPSVYSTKDAGHLVLRLGRVYFRHAMDGATLGELVAIASELRAFRAAAIRLQRGHAAP